MNEGKMHACNFSNNLVPRRWSFLLHARGAVLSCTAAHSYINLAPYSPLAWSHASICILHPLPSNIPAKTFSPLSFNHFKDLVACTNGFVSVLAILITQVLTHFRNFKVSDFPCFVVKGDRGVNLLASLCNR